MGDKADAAFISRTIESLDVAKVREWLVDRQVNCLRHARSKTGADREGWLEDYAHFSAAIGMIDWSDLERQDAAGTLLPCPFCDVAPHTREFIDGGQKPFGLNITCPKCLVSVQASDKQAAISKWNTRRVSPKREALAFTFLTGMHDQETAEVLRRSNGVAWNDVLKGIDAVLALSTRNASVEPATAQVEWLEDAARYFEARPTLGEDMAHWANVHNAEMCRKIAAILAVRLDEAADRIKEVVDEAGQEGAAAGWKPCSGCYETEDGHPVGEYRHSKQFGCAVGGGCDECGGLGVVWEYHSASDLAWLERQLTEPDPSSLDEAAIRKDEREKFGFVQAMDIAERGFETWAAKDHNAKWVRRIDGTPIKNDLLVNIAEAFRSAVRNGGKQP